MNADIELVLWACEHGVLGFCGMCCDEEMRRLTL